MIDRSYIEVEHLLCGCGDERIEKAARDIKGALHGVASKWQLCPVGTRRALALCMVRNTSDELEEISLTASIALQVLDDLDRRLAFLGGGEHPASPNVSDVGNA